MIGFYVHHVGRGHLHRALAIASRLPDEVTALSSLAPDPDWPGPWLALARDDEEPDPIDPTANGCLHWAPRHGRGLQRRMAQVVEWIERSRPAAMVVDLSVEVALQARLLGVPVVVTALPGTRADHAHQLGYRIADAILAPWPAEFREIAPDLHDHAAKVHYTGALSRFAGRLPGEGVPPAGRDELLAIVLGGTGGAATPLDISAAGWSVRVLGVGGWVDDPWPDICSADVVVTHAGLGALADVATAGRPAVVLPQLRPHAEQKSTARGLSDGGLATVSFRPPEPAQWPALLDAARCRGGGDWHRWLAGTGAAGAAEVISTVARTRASRCG